MSDWLLMLLDLLSKMDPMGIFWAVTLTAFATIIILIFIPSFIAEHWDWEWIKMALGIIILCTIAIAAIIGIGYLIHVGWNYAH